MTFDAFREHRGLLPVVGLGNRFTRTPEDFQRDPLLGEEVHQFGRGAALQCIYELARFIVDRSNRQVS